MGNLVNDAKTEATKVEADLKGKIAALDAKALSFGQKWWWAIALACGAIGFIAGLVW